jgi:predicted acyl esterase
MNMSALIREDSLRFATSSYYTERTPDMSRINVPVYAWANDGGLGLHMRGTIEGFLNADSAPFRKLRTYVGEDPDQLYTRASADEQKRFFDRFLKGQENGFEKEPRVLVKVKKNGVWAADRTGDEYPLENTRSQKLFLDCASKTLTSAAPAAATSVGYHSEYGLDSSLVRFSTSPLSADLELIGPMRLHLAVSADAIDADLFVAVREFRPDGSEVTSLGAQDAAVPISAGWLRASMRASEAGRSTVYRTWHTYDQVQPLFPGVPVSLDVNIWPAAWIVQKGNVLVVEVGGKEQKGLDHFPHPPTGSYLANGVPIDNKAPPPCNVTVYSGGSDPSFLLLPVYAATTT